MAIGKNVNLEDKIIKKTAKGSNTSNKNNVSNVSITNIIGRPSLTPGKKTYGTAKMTFYVKKELLKKLYNFAYWDRSSLTEAFNIALEDGLKNKNTKQKPKK